MLRVSEPTLGAEECAALADVIERAWITMGPRVSAFEEAFAVAQGCSHAVAVSSCTAGLHLSLVALGIGPGDEVLVPAMTFVATASSVLHAGASPVFVDIASLSTPVMSLADAERRLTPRTRAILLVHFAGYVVDRDAWTAFARTHDLILIEDAAHAAGNPAAGTCGAAAIFSFYGNKNMTTAEGGMIVTEDARLADALRRRRAHGLTSTGFERLNGRSPNYDVTCLGFNYRMDELRAAMGLAQLRHLAGWNRRRRRLTALYRVHLRDEAPGVIMPFADLPAREDVESACHIMPVVLPAEASREDVMRRLLADGVQTTIHYPPCHLLSFYRSREPDVALPLAEEFGRRELTLPLHPGLDPADVAHVCRSLAGALRAVRTDRRELSDAMAG